MAATCDNLTNAKRLAVTVGIKKAWCIQLTDGQHYVVSDVYGQLGSGRRWAVTDDDAIDLARKAGVTCEDDGRIA
jgi:hypothetical protein